MNKRILIILVFASLFFGNTNFLFAKDTIQVVLLAGQSNMEGSGLYKDLSSTDKERIKAISSRVMFSNKGREPSTLTYSFSDYQLDKLGYGEVFGPEMFIGLTLADANPGKEYLLIKLAQGGTALYGAWNPEWDLEKADYAEYPKFKKTLKLYEIHHEYIRKNLKRLDDAGKPYKIIGMAWMQGENDAAKELSSKTYEENLKKLIRGYRTSFSKPELPFVMGQINSTYGNFAEGPEMVRDAMVTVAKNDPFCEVLKTTTDRLWLDYPKHADNVHYNAEGQKRLGRAMAKKMMLMQDSNSEKASTYIDNNGVIRYTNSDEEICAFGTNYAVPFSYWDWRKPIGADHIQAIDEDVYHIARLGLDAYRIHVWFDYISDKNGDLTYNQHFQLFDYLLFKLKERNIKIFITPMYSANVSDMSLWAAQQNYLTQLVAHVNPYTGIAYKDDADIIAMGIANEPHHWKAQELTTPFINKMLEAMRLGGFKNPIFYNMTTCANQLEHVLSTEIQGGTFQWYPSGLTANHNQIGNMLPNVDQYVIPFNDELKARKLPKFVYEFSPSDIGASSHIYPAMARSFREAEFQLAAFFSYDPMHAAYCNVAYRTHFMNLAYTPKKAIGLMIASEAFHAIPLGKSYGRYPKNNDFESIHLNYENDLAELVTDTKFLYSNNTNTIPNKPEVLEQLAGTGASPIVKYSGTGAYFFDKLEDGIWRLELMPDAHWVADPFFIPHLNREVAVVVNRVQNMTVSLPDLGDGFSISAVNDGNSYQTKAQNGAFKIETGTYILCKDGVTSDWKSTDAFKHFILGEYHAPNRKLENTYVLHNAPRSLTVGETHTLSVKVISPEIPNKVELVVLGVGNGIALDMNAIDSYTYELELPSKYVAKAGILQYHISVKQGNEYKIYPADKTDESLVKRRYYGDDRLLDDTMPYKVNIVNSNSAICLFDADFDWHKITKAKRKDRMDLMPSAIPNKSMIHFNYESFRNEEKDYSFRTYCRERLLERMANLDMKKSLVLYGKALNDKSCKVKLALIMRDGITYGKTIEIEPLEDSYRLDLKDLLQVKSVLLPRPYPEFLPYWFEPSIKSKFNLSEVESIQVSLGTGIKKADLEEKHGIAIGWITLE